MYTSQLLTTLKRLTLIMIIYTVCRLIFLLFNWSFFSIASISSIAESLILGLRFDISTVLLINSLFILLSILPIELVFKIAYQRILKIIFITINLPAIFINVADASYFSFKGKRTTIEVFGILDDVVAQSLQLAIYYWYVPLLTLIFGGLLWWQYPKQSLIIETKKRLWYNWLIFIFLIGLVVLGIRGGLQLKPIRPNMAFVQQPNILGNLVLNTPFVMIQTSQLPTVKRLDYYKNEVELLKYIEIKYGAKATYKPVIKGKPNVVIFILESFSSEYTGFGNPWKGYTPFLDSISGKGLFFRNHFSNGRTSIEGLPAITAAIPALMEETYITSTYQSNRIKGLADVLRRKSYETSFYHAGKNGTMGFDMFAKNVGFTNYYGSNEYNGSSTHYDGNWGIFDHHYLPYFCNQLNEKKQPFFSAVFTLSSHQPYTIPDEFEGKFAEGSVPIVRTIRYADFALQQFFAMASKQAWFDNTIFIFTADHTQDKIQPWSIYNDYHVPLLFYSPRYITPCVVSDKITQHLDIAPSVLDMLNVNELQDFKFGHSVFDSTYGGRAIVFDGSSESTMIIHQKLISVLRPDGKVDFIEISNFNDTKIEDTENLKAFYTTEIKAIQQFHNNGLLENTWFK